MYMFSEKFMKCLTFISARADFMICFVSMKVAPLFCYLYCRKLENSMFTNAIIHCPFPQKESSQRKIAWLAFTLC